MSVDVDIFADLNPAYCSAVIFSFCEGFQSESDGDVDFPLILLPLPIVLSNNLKSSFDHTNINTGFFSWIDRNPQILLGLAERVEGILELTKDAIEYGVTYSVLDITDEGKCCHHTMGLKKKFNFNSSSIVKQSLTNGKRLGQWMGQINSPATIFNHLGLEI